MIAFHEHNERKCSDMLLNSLREGKQIALISDAGTPLISDPGYFLVHAAREQNIAVVPIPGPSAIIAALSVAGMPTDRFIFEGFLPVKNKLRQARLMQLQYEKRTLVFYEAPHRILECLHDIALIFGASREMTVLRELTKKFETTLYGSCENLINRIQEKAKQRLGEFVIVVKGNDHEIPTEDHSLSVLKILLAELPLKQAVNLAAKLLQKRKNELYQQALTLSQQD
jgi:16S rRNA (cytidine1402-2'-O)-methyltransferase